MKTLYLAGPFRGLDAYAVYRNVQKAEAVMFEVIQAALAQTTPVAVVCPHSMSANFNGTFTDGYWLKATLELLDRSDAVLMLPGWQKSVGALGELERARLTGTPIFYEVQEVLDWLKEEYRQAIRDYVKKGHSPKAEAHQHGPFCEYCGDCCCLGSTCIETLDGKHAFLKEES